MASNQALSEVTSTEIPLEGRLEDWLESDISMLAPICWSSGARCGPPSAASSICCGAPGKLAKDSR